MSGEKLILGDLAESNGRWVRSQLPVISSAAADDSRPFGSASEDFAKFETILLVGGKLSL
jgi:hypothetical protein